MFKNVVQHHAVVHKLLVSLVVHHFLVGLSVCAFEHAVDYWVSGHSWNPFVIATCLGVRGVLNILSYTIVGAVH